MSPARPTKPGKRAGKTAKFLEKPGCITCRKARSFLKRRGFQLYFRNLVKHRLSSAELEKLIGSRDHTEFLNPRNELYRRKKMKENPPPRREAIRLVAKEPNLIRRPVVLCGGRVVLGFDKDRLARL